MGGPQMGGGMRGGRGGMNRGGPRGGMGGGPMGGRGKLSFDLSLIKI